MANPKPIALVTGANKGIGLEIARQLAGTDVTVIIGARDRDRGRKAPTNYCRWGYLSKVSRSTSTTR